MKILLIEDERDLSNNIVTYLASDHYLCEQAFTYREAIDIALYYIHLKNKLTDMIKSIISDLAYDRVSLSNALTRAKIVCSKVKNEAFRTWVNRELEGYDDGTDLPTYRKLKSSIYVVQQLPFSSPRTLPVVFTKEMLELEEVISVIPMKESISNIENQLSRLNSNRAQVSLHPEQVKMLASSYENAKTIVSGYYEVATAQVQQIIESTKQKLLDTLIELDNEFPDLENLYKDTKENTDKVSNIINANIYGNNSPLNIAAGKIVEQFNIAIPSIDVKMLTELGVQQEEIDELRVIIENEEEDKPQKKSKVLSWIGSVSSSMAARGLHEAIPKVIDYVQQLV